MSGCPSQRIGLDGIDGIPEQLGIPTVLLGSCSCAAMPLLPNLLSLLRSSGGKNGDVSPPPDAIREDFEMHFGAWAQARLPCLQSTTS